MAAPASTKEIPDTSVDPPDGFDPALADPAEVSDPVVEEPFDIPAAQIETPPVRVLTAEEAKSGVVSRPVELPEENILTNGQDSARVIERECVGEMVFRLYKIDGEITFDAEFPHLGLMGPGRFEQAVPFILNKMMQAIAAAAREAEGLPPMRM